MRLPFVLLLLNLFLKYSFAVPFAVPIIGGIAAAFGGWFINCRYNECCNDKSEKKKVWIHYDERTFKQLDEDLRRQLYGQPLVRQTVVHALRNHWIDETPLKPLVMSFHGWTGGGKNYVADMITNRLFKKGRDSKFVHRISGMERFPDERFVHNYKQELREMVTGNVSHCGRQIFVIDEVDKIPAGVIDGLKPFLDYKDNVNGVDYRKSVFIFLSNTGGKDITQLTYEFWKKGRSRDEITMKDMEPLISQGAFNEKGGLKAADVIANNLIDYYVPFLPLENNHVKLCIKDYIVNKYGESQFLEDRILEMIADQLDYFPSGTMLYSRSGCKKIHTKVLEYIRQFEETFAREKFEEL